jgi:membrane-bound lytic murein transglycosylase F
MQRALRIALGLVTLVLVAACAPPEEQQSGPPRIVADTYTETGDFGAIRDHGQLRLLVVREPGDIDRLPRAGTPTSSQIRAAARFARSVGLDPVIVLVDHFSELVPALMAGRGDIVVANLRMTEARRERLDFTIALGRTRQVVTKRVDDPLTTPSDLAGRTITVGRRSRYWETAQALQDEHPELRVESLPGLSTRRQLDKLARGEIDLAITDSNTLKTALHYREGITSAFPIAEETGVGWGVRPEADELKAVLDRFISQRKLADYQRERHTGDLPAIKRRQTLRVATRNSAANYFAWRGQLLGFEYELAKHFADYLGVRLEVVVANGENELLSMLRNGRADFAASFLTRDDAASDNGIAYSRPYHHAVQQVVTDRNDTGVDDTSDLQRRRLHARKGSDAWAELERLREQRSLWFELAPVDSSVAIESIIQRVASGDYDLALVDDHIAKNAAVWHDRIRTGLELGEPEAHQWAFRAGNEQLRAAADQFLERTYRSEFYNVIYAKYFEDQERIRRYQTQRVSRGNAQQLTPFDALIKRYAQRHGLDWRLVAAQIFQESSFDPDKTSWVGAQGLMQVMPKTARQVGVNGDLTDPETNIRAGTRYLAWLRERFEDDLRVRDRMWLTLAAFNAGIGHVRDARRIARSFDGLDRDRWFDNVEKAMRKLSQPQYFRDARHGYVRGSEPVNYVRSIRERYQAYILWTNDCWPNCEPRPDPQVVEFVSPDESASGFSGPQMRVNETGN